jgi:hypothetical protein
MNTFARSIGERSASIVDGTVDVVTAAVDESCIAATAFGKGYREQHALNLKRRAARRAWRDMRNNLNRNVFVPVHAARSAS